VSQAGRNVAKSAITRQQQQQRKNVPAAKESRRQMRGSAFSPNIDGIEDRQRGCGGAASTKCTGDVKLPLAVATTSVKAVRWYTPSQDTSNSGSDHRYVPLGRSDEALCWAWTGIVLCEMTK
jgi:hypothetical protein